MVTVPVWERGKGSPPADLPSGEYLLHFAGNWTAISLAHHSASAVLDKRLPFSGGHHLRIVSSLPVRFSNDSGYLQLRISVEGFPWALLLVAIAALFVTVSLIKVERIVVDRSANSTLFLVALAGAVGIVGYKMLKST